MKPQESPPFPSEQELRRKWTFRARGRQVVLVKKPREKTSHVLMKALLWALYLPEYPDLAVEVGVGDRYQPDVVALDGEGRPRFWAEAGAVGRAKVFALARRFPHTHLAVAKWGVRLAPFERIAAEAVARARRTAPFDLLRFPADSAERFLDSDHRLRVRFEDLEWVRLHGGGERP